MSGLIRLYPRDWRARYEEEFLSLLAERPPDARDRVDIIRGAIDARMRPQVRRGSPDPGPASPAPHVASRTLGFATLAGALLWLVALVMILNGPIVVDGGSSYRDGAAALPFVFLAFVLLGVGLVGVARSLPRGSDLGGLAAAVAAVAGGTWALMPWVFPLLLIASVGYVALAILARRSGVWSVADAALLVGGVVLSWVLVVPGLLGIGTGPSQDSYLAFWIVMTSLWISVGHALIVSDRSTISEGSAGSA